MTPPTAFSRLFLLAALALATMASQSHAAAEDGARVAYQQQDPKKQQITATVVRSAENETIKLRADFPDDTPQVKVSLFNLLGKVVEVHPQTSATKGANDFQFRTRGLPNGPYIVVLEAAGQRLIHKVLLSR